MFASPGQKNFSPQEAADLLTAAGYKVSSDTVRRMCERYGRHLSPSANPEPGTPRRLTAEDVAILRAARAYRDQGLDTEQIDDQLSQLVLDEPVDVPTLPAEAAPELPEPLLILQRMAATLERTTGALERLENVISQQADQEERIARLERENERLRMAAPPPAPSPWLLVAIGAFVSALVVLAIVALALAMGWIG